MGKKQFERTPGILARSNRLSADADATMAPMNSCELATLLITAQEDLKVLFVSGCAGEKAPRRKQASPGALFLPKPFTSNALVSKVGEALHDEPPSRALTASGYSTLWEVAEGAMVSKFCGLCGGTIGYTDASVLAGERSHG
jgi:FixJ family two-component response regulator